MKNVADGHLVGWDFLGDDGKDAYDSEVDERNPSFTDLPDKEPSEVVFKRELEEARHPEKRKVTRHTKKKNISRQRERG